MRLESFIRKSLRLKAHTVTEVQERPDGMLVRIDWIQGRRVRCGACGRRTPRVVHRQGERRWRDLSLRDRSLTLTYRPCRVRCRFCGVRVEKVPWAARWQRVTDALLASVARLSRMLSWKETAGHFRLDWKTVAAAVKDRSCGGPSTSSTEYATDCARRASASCSSVL